MNFFGKTFGKRQPTSSAPSEFVDMLGRFARTVEEAVQGRESDAGSLAREVKAELLPIASNTQALFDARRTIAARIAMGRQPAEVAAELYTGFVLFDPRLFAYPPVIRHWRGRCAIPKAAGRLCARHDKFLPIRFRSQSRRRTIGSSLVWSGQGAVKQHFNLDCLQPERLSTLAGFAWQTCLTSFIGMRVRPASFVHRRNRRSWYWRPSIPILLPPISSTEHCCVRG